MNLRPAIAPLVLALLGCGRGAGRAHPDPAPSGSAGAPPATSSSATASSAASGSASGPTPSAPSSASALSSSSAAAVPLDPPVAPPLPATFAGARSTRACNAQTVELAAYLVRGEVALGGGPQGVAATWRARLSGKPQEQVAFASFDAEGRPAARARGVGLTTRDVQPRAFASGAEWTVVWFDDKGLAKARPRTEPLPPPEISHVNAIGPEVAADVALSASTAAKAVVAGTPFGADKAKLGIFVFAPEDNVASVKALGVTHHGKEPHRSAVAAGPSGTFVIWDEGGALVGSRFDAAGKENDAPCTIAPASPDRRDRVSLAATPAGAIALWMEGTRVRTRALDATGCPSSPIWTAAEGRWASLTSLGDSALAVWVNADNHLLAARLQPTGAPTGSGLDASEGTSGVKDPPAVVACGAGKVAFGWSEVMSPVISTKRLSLRLVNASCIP